MALSVKLQTRQTASQTLGQSQSLTMTPQLVQSIKLLQMSSADLLRHIEAEAERNPLVEIAETEFTEAPEAAPHTIEPADSGAVTEELDTSRTRLEEKLGTTLENTFETDRTGERPAPSRPTQSGSGGGDHDYNLEEFIAEQRGLHAHLTDQLAHAQAPETVRLLAENIIGHLDDDGYLRDGLAPIAAEAGASDNDAEAALALIQAMEPAGVGGRDLAECLRLQLIDNNRLDPAMAVLLDHLELLAKRDFTALQELCGVSLEDILDMAGEIRGLDPRPGRAFDPSPVLAVIPDVFVSPRPDGSFGVELNPAALPKVLVNRTYRALVKRPGADAEETAFMSDCLQDANWLVKSLEQRAHTILKTMTEIVRRQDGFFAFGVTHLKPMSLKQVADAIGMHESTISRVTSNKYVLTNRGIYEMKYFFTAALAATSGEEGHSAEAVRHRIAALIAAEPPRNVLSDDAIVDKLEGEGIAIARRTVAKYREAMHIPSSIARRREKKAAAGLS